MARPNSDGLELSFRTLGKGQRRGRWSKTIDGRREYFGYGEHHNDHASYTRALRQYHRRLAELDQQKALASIPQFLSVADVLRQVAGHDPQSAAMLASLEAEEAARQKEADPEELNWNGLIDLYLASRAKDRDLTASSPEVLQRNRRLSGQGYGSLVTHLNTLREFVGRKAVGTVRDVEKTLNAYRDLMVERMVMTEGGYTAHTVNTKLSKLRTLIRWSVTHHHIDHMPANLEDVCSGFQTQKCGKPLETSAIQRLWAAATPRMRAWMAVALNTGGYPGDVARLHADHVRDGRIVRHRHKTGAPSNHKLWPVTLQLIEQTRDDRTKNTGGLLWITNEGNPLVDYERNRDTLGQLFARLCKRAGVKATWSQFRDTSAKHIEAISRRQGKVDPALVSLFLAHKDNRTAAYYLSDDPADMETGSLDRALEELDGIYGLRADAPSTAPPPATPGAKQTRGATTTRVDKPVLHRRLVKRDDQGNVISTLEPKRGRPPQGYRLEVVEGVSGSE